MSRIWRAATSTTEKEAVSEKAVSRQVIKPTQSASAAYQTTMLDMKQLDSLLKDTPPSDVANGKAAQEHGDSAVAGGPSREDRVCIHWSRQGCRHGAPPRCD
ncbi:hypothetical protein MRX96_046121 [Rhipicephalus microplus]